MVGGLRDGGPVLSLELRASSRRGRTYVLRLAYVAALGAFVVLVWTAVVQRLGGPTGGFTVSRMAEAGEEIVQRIMWFLLVAAPLAAILLMYNAFADELGRGLLPTLLSSPLTFEGIVMGRFLGRMVQLSVLVVATLPALAVVRVFGGVPWGYVLGGTFVAVTLAALAGAIAMQYAAASARPHKAILASLAFTGVCGLPAGLWLAQCSSEMARGGRQVAVLLWPALCAMGLLLTVVFLDSCIGRFRAAVLHAMGHEPPRPPRVTWPNYAYLPPVPRDPPRFDPPGANDVAPELREAAREFRAAARRRRSGAMPLVISGSPVVWRAMRRSVLLEPKIAFGAAAIVHAYFCFIAQAAGALGSHVFHTLVLGATVLGIGASVVVLSANAIAREKESGWLPLLLMTPLPDGHILAAKVHTILWRITPIAAVAALHAAVFAAVGVLHPIVLWNLTFLLAGTAVFTLGVGTYCSVRFRRTTTAAMVTAGVVAGLWAIAPAVLPFVAASADRPGQDAARQAHALFQLSPLVQARDVAEAATAHNATDPLGPPDRPSPAPRAARALRHCGAVTGYALLYVGVGAVLLWRAKCRLRRNVF